MPNCPDIPQLSCVAGEIGSAHNQDFIDWLNELRDTVCADNTVDPAVCPDNACPIAPIAIDIAAGDDSGGDYYQCTQIGGDPAVNELRIVDVVCEFEQPIERIDIRGLVDGDWTNDPDYMNSQFIDIALPQTYTLSETFINGRMPNEFLQHPTLSAQGMWLEFIDSATGLPAVGASNTVRVRGSGGTDSRDSISFDVIVNPQWFVQHLRVDAPSTNANGISNHTFNAAPIANIGAATTISLQNGRLIRGTQNEGAWIHFIELIGTSAAPQVYVEYGTQGGFGAGSTPLAVQLVSFEG